MRAFTVVDALRKLTRRDTIAETVGWSAVKDLPGASAHGIGFLLLTGADDASPTTATPPVDKGVANPTATKPLPPKPVPPRPPIKLAPRLEQRFCKRCRVGW